MLRKESVKSVINLIHGVRDSGDPPAESDTGVSRTGRIVDWVLNGDCQAGGRDSRAAGSKDAPEWCVLAAVTNIHRR